jgi:hypothetical protein
MLLRLFAPSPEDVKEGGCQQDNDKRDGDPDANFGGR